MSETTDDTDMEVLAPDHPENPFSNADRLIFVSDEGWHQFGKGHNAKSFEFVRDGARWEAHWDVGDGEEQIDHDHAELMERVMEDYEDGYAIALNGGQLVGGGWVSAVEYIDFSDYEDHTFSIGVEDSTIHNVDIPRQ